MPEVAVAPELAPELATLSAAVRGKAPPVVGKTGTISFSAGKEPGTIAIWRKDGGVVALQVTHPKLNFTCDFPQTGAPTFGPNFRISATLAGQIAEFVRTRPMNVEDAISATPSVPPRSVPVVTDQKSAEETIFRDILPAPPSQSATQSDRREEFWVAVGKGCSGFTVECCGARNGSRTYFRIKRRDVDAQGDEAAVQTLELQATTFVINGTPPFFGKGVAGVYEGDSKVVIQDPAKVAQQFVTWVNTMITNPEIPMPLINAPVRSTPPSEASPSDGAGAASTV